MPTEQMRRAASAPWCDSVLKSSRCNCVQICRECANAQRPPWLPVSLHTQGCLQFEETGCLHRCLGMRMMMQAGQKRQCSRLRKARVVSTVARRCLSSTECLFVCLLLRLNPRPETRICRLLCDSCRLPPL
jgi:hypothetical protein